MTLQEYQNAIKATKTDNEGLFAEWLTKPEKVKKRSFAMLLILTDKHFHYYLANIAACSQSKVNSKLALENLADETKGNHPRLGKDFAKKLNIDLSAFRKEIEPLINEIDSDIENKNNTVFLSGFMAGVEACSPMMMRAMMEYAKTKGVKKSVYIDIHTSPLEEHHADILIKGLNAEIKAVNGKFEEAMKGLQKWQRMMSVIFNFTK